MKRRAIEQHICERRARDANNWGFPAKLKNPGRWRKRKPLDCGNVRCGICHYSKYYKRDDRFRIADRAFREQLAEVG